MSAYGNWEEDRGSLGSSGGNNWVAGVQISVDILPLGKRAQLAQETAAKQRIDAQLAASQQHVRLEVSQAHIHRQTAELSLETAQAAMDQSAESLRILKNRYGAGLATSPICCGPKMPSGRANRILACGLRQCHGLCRTALRNRDTDSRCGGGFAMKKVFTSVCLPFSRRMAGCHGSESASPAAGPDRAGAGCREPAATGSAECARHGNGSRTGDGGCLRAGCGPHPAGAGARGRQRARRADAGGARRCGAARLGGSGAGGGEGRSRRSRPPRRPMPSWRPARWSATGNCRPRRA